METDPITNYFNELNALELPTETIPNKKGPDLTYTPWAAAWEALKSRDPDANYSVHTFAIRNDEGRQVDSSFVNSDGMVKVTVDAFGRSHTMHLPVKDNYNNPIENPDSMDVNNAIMRCFTKAIAMHGVGLYPYMGEDIPKEEPKFTAKEIRRLREAAEGKPREKVAKLYNEHTDIDDLVDAVEALDDAE